MKQLRRVWALAKFDWVKRLRNRRRVALVAIVAILLGAIAPVALTAWLASVMAERNTHETLNLYGSVPVIRMEKVIEQAHDVLQTVEGMTGCTPEHIAAMRNAVMQSYFIDEVGYFEDGELACSSWGMAPPGIAENRIDFVLPNGVGLRASITPGQTDAGSVMALHLGAHNVLVSHTRLVEVLSLQGVSVALAYMPVGAPPLLLASGGDAVAAELLSQAPLERKANAQGHRHVGDLFRSGDLVAVAMMPPELTHSSDQLDYMLRLLPLAFVLACIIVFNVIWLTLRRLDLRHETKAALRSGNLRLVYQPVVELATGRCVGAEALIRWQQRDGSYINPEVFIPVAEQSALIGQISTFVARRACEDLGNLLRTHPEAHLSLNMTAYDVTSGDIVRTLEDTFGRAGVPPTSVWLELTERSLIDFETSCGKLSALRDAGYRIVIDDFGTGYSNLQYLQEMKLDALKIDKSFVDVIGRQTANRSVIETIIELATTLELDIVAEGIETQAQLSFLRQRNVRLGQGYFIARPMELADFVAFYAAWKDGAPEEVTWVA
tara:strand:- start:58608 stop:60257 length:1650 start_codon:yes stop_codon:yes gene_type:complete